MAYDHSRLFKRVEQCLSSSPNLQLSELSRRLQIERHTLRNIIKLRTGKSFREWRNNLMIERALSIFQEHPELSIKEVAFALGYKSPQSFERFFKRKSRTVPSKVRRSANKRDQ